MIALGIDPGASGGFALVGPDGPIDWSKMLDTEADTYERIHEFRQHADVALIEKVSAMPKQGVSSTFKFGANYGMLRGFLIALEIPWIDVTPGRWQQAMRCRTGGDKNISKARAQQLFPQVKRMTHAIADALLIAEYGRREWCKVAG